MRILFHSNQLGIRGTEVALYDMAHFNEIILGNESYIAAPANSDMSTYDKFAERFGSSRVILYEDFSQLIDRAKKDCAVEAAYFIKAGFDDGKLIPDIKNIVHAVFDLSQPHGDHYLAVSKWLGDIHSTRYMPHIVHLPEVKEDFRKYLGIPREATVFGRYGGYDQFDVPYLSDVILACANQGMYFLLMNTKPLSCEHSNIIYLDPTYDLETKAAFINTCDAMIHGRTEGETFGLAIAEFMHQGKPVITNIDGKDKNQVLIMKDSGHYYSSDNELFFILSFFEKKQIDKNLLEEFRPSVIMKKFKNLINNG